MTLPDVSQHTKASWKIVVAENGPQAERINQFCVRVAEDLRMDAQQTQNALRALYQGNSTHLFSEAVRTNAWQTTGITVAVIALFALCASLPGLDASTGQLQLPTGDDWKSIATRTDVYGSLGAGGIGAMIALYCGAKLQGLRGEVTRLVKAKLSKP